MTIILTALIALVSPPHIISYMCDQGKYTFVGSGSSNEILITEKLAIDLKSGYGAVSFKKSKCRTWNVE